MPPLTDEAPDPPLVGSIVYAPLRVGYAPLSAGKPRPAVVVARDCGGTVVAALTSNPTFADGTRRRLVPRAWTGLGSPSYMWGGRLQLVDPSAGPLPLEGWATRNLADLVACTHGHELSNPTAWDRFRDCARCLPWIDRTKVGAAVHTMGISDPGAATALLATANTLAKSNRPLSVKQLTSILYPWADAARSKAVKRRLEQLAARGLAEQDDNGRWRISPRLCFD